MSLRLLTQQYGACFFATTSFIGHQPHGNRPGVYDALADSLIFYLARYDARLPAYVFMPTHIHLLVLLDGAQLGNFMRDFKKYLSQEALRRLIATTASFWEQGYDRQVIYSEDIFRIKLNYIHDNPVKAGLVHSPAEWPWSSAGAYLKETLGRIPVWKGWSF